MTRFPLVLAVLALTSVVGGVATAAPTLDVAEGQHQAGDPLVIRVADGDAPLAGAAVTITHYTGTQVEHEEVVETDAAGVATVVPPRVGLLRVSIDGTSTTVSVRARGVPLSGLVVLLVAGGILALLTVLGIRGVLATGTDLPAA